MNRCGNRKVMVASFGIFPCDLPVRTLLGDLGASGFCSEMWHDMYVAAVEAQYNITSYNMTSYHIISARWVCLSTNKKKYGMASIWLLYGFYMASILYTTIKPPVFLVKKNNLAWGSTVATDMVPGWLGHVGTSSVIGDSDKPYGNRCQLYPLVMTNSLPWYRWP